MTRVGAIIQARLDSVRLPHKVFRTIGGKVVLDYVIDAALGAELVDVVWVTTPDLAIHEYTEMEAESWGNLRLHAQLYTGPRDCLAEYVQCARADNLDLIVRLTSDCPMLQAQHIDEALTEFEKLRVDYFYNGVDGADVEIFTRAALESADKYAVAPDEREHVGTWPRRNLLYHIGLSLSDCRRDNPYRSLDTAEDLAYIRQWFDEHSRKREGEERVSVSNGCPSHSP